MQAGCNSINPNVDLEHLHFEEVTTETPKQVTPKYHGLGTLRDPTRAVKAVSHIVRHNTARSAHVEVAVAATRLTLRTCNRSASLYFATPQRPMPMHNIVDKVEVHT